MIQSFKCKETQKIWLREGSFKLPNTIERVALRKLLQLQKAKGLGDLKVPPGNRLEALKGNRLGQYSIRINDQWRICFRWHKEDAYDVEIVDYH